MTTTRGQRKLARKKESGLEKSLGKKRQNRIRMEILKATGTEEGGEEGGKKRCQQVMR